MFEEGDVGLADLGAVGDALAVGRGARMADPIPGISQQQTRVAAEIHFQQEASIPLEAGDV